MIMIKIDSRGVHVLEKRSSQGEVILCCTSFLVPSFLQSEVSTWCPSHSGQPTAATWLLTLSTSCRAAPYQLTLSLFPSADPSSNLWCSLTIKPDSFQHRRIGEKKIGAFAPSSIFSSSPHSLKSTQGHPLISSTSLFNSPQALLLKPIKLTISSKDWV